MVQEIMQRTNTASEETVMVRDAINDILMAQHAGITPIVVLTGHLNRNQAEDLNVNYIIEDVTRIEEVLSLLS